MNNLYKIRKFKCIGCGRVVKKRRSKDNMKYCSLECYRRGNRINRRTGKIIKCKYCGTEVYKGKKYLEKHKSFFCSLKCANLYQGRNKLKFTCKTCGKGFKWSKSRIKNNNPTYCSIECRNKDKEWVKRTAINANLVQQYKKGLNKLELSGRSILQDLGMELEKDFAEQILVFDKFLVDVLLLNTNVIIQWDGEYWHSKIERKRLDKSQDAYLNKCGYVVLRFTDKQISNSRENVCGAIKEWI